MQKIAALYCRTSKDTDDAFSVESQIDLGRAYAAKFGIAVPEEFQFREDYTGTAMSRPELDRVRKLIREKAITALIVYRTDRLARKVGVADYLLDELFESGIELHVVTWEAPIRETPDDRTRFHFEIMFGDRERRLIKERTWQGKRKKIDQGIWPGQGIDKYGYNKTGKKRETKLHQVPEEAAVVLRIFESFVRYRSALHYGVMARICDDLDAASVPTPSVARGHHTVRAKWSPSMLYAILRDECYIGRFHIDRWKQKKTEKGTHSSGKRPKEEWHTFEFPELRIVPQELWEQAQKLLNEGKRESGPTPEYPYLMNKRMRCDVCHRFSILTNVCKGQGGTGKTYRYYSCGSASRGRKAREDDPHCALPTNIRVEDVDERIWAWMCELARDPEVMLRGYQKIQIAQAKKHEDVTSEIERAKQKIVRAEKTLRNYADMLDEELITREVMRDKKAEVDAQIKSAQSIIEEYERKLDERRMLTDAEIQGRVRLIKQIKEAVGNLEELPPSKRRECVVIMDITARLGLEQGQVYVDIYWAEEFAESLWIDSAHSSAPSQDR